MHILGHILTFSLLGYLSAAQLQPPLYRRLPTGSIKPAGWQLDQARVQAEGLAGNIRDFGSYVKGSIWVEGGSIEYSEMHEAAPYWFNGQVALAFQLQDEKLIAQVEDFLNYNLDNQGEDGWIGPEEYDPDAEKPRLTWPRYLVLLGLIQYAEADPTQTDRIVDAMHRFVSLVHTIWSNGEEGDESMGFQYGYQYVRWEELVYSLQWLYDNYPRDKEEELIETMQLLRDRGFSWKNDWYTESTFPKTAVATGFSHITHGVNNAEALKSEALAWRFTGDESDKQNTFDRLGLIYGYHGRASGTFAADEHLAGIGPSRGTELCTVVEQIFSLATIYQIFGNNSVADRAEKIAYNALPAGIYHDWWSHQYDQQVNQIWSQVMDPPPFGNNGPYSNIFGFEPNYPCCTVNHPSGYPKFWAHAFFTADDGASLAHVFLGPYTFSGTLGESNNVEVTVDTIYPFGSTLVYTITASENFDFKVRIPEWAKQSGLSTITIEDETPSALEIDDASFQTVQISAGTTTFTVFLDAPLDIETRGNGAVAVTKGVLNYAVQLEYNQTIADGMRSVQALNDVRRLFPDAPSEYLEPYDPNTIDLTLLPTVEWRLAIDPSTIEIIDNSNSTTSLPYYAWAPGSQPITMTAKACQIEWDIELSAAASPPPSPNTCVGEVFDVILAPFGSGKLKLGEIPTMEATS